MLHLAEETKVFGFLWCVKFRAISFYVCFKFNFMEWILKVSLWFQIEWNVDYVKLTSFKILNIDI